MRKLVEVRNVTVAESGNSICFSCELAKTRIPHRAAGRPCVALTIACLPADRSASTYPPRPTGSARRPDAVGDCAGRAVAAGR